MGLLFTPRKVRNVWQERGEKIGEARGLKRLAKRALKPNSRRGTRTCGRQ